MEGCSFRDDSDIEDRNQEMWKRAGVFAYVHAYAADSCDHGIVRVQFFCPFIFSRGVCRKLIQNLSLLQGRRPTQVAFTTPETQIGVFVDFI